MQTEYLIYNSLKYKDTQKNFNLKHTHLLCPTVVVSNHKYTNFR